MQKPLWLEWRWCALVQWVRDLRGQDHRTDPLWLQNEPLPLVAGCMTRHPYCLICTDHVYHNPTFKKVIEHVYSRHPGEVSRLMLTQ